MSRRSSASLRVSLFVALFVAFCAGVAVGHHQTSSKPHTIVLLGESTEFFVGGNASEMNCELDNAHAVGSRIPTLDYCQTVYPAQSVELKTTGAAKLCVGMNCLGNPGIETPTFPVGDNVVLGATTCALRSTYVRCTMGPHGFVLSDHQGQSRAW